MSNVLCFQKPKLTVLTDPIPWGRDFFAEGSRRIARAFRNRYFPNKKNYNCSQYRGHFAVTRSLVEGLNSINADFNYNPKVRQEIAETVVVLAGVKTLRQAIRLKKLGYIKTLLAGPNITVFSSDHDSLLAADEIDCIITPSEWVRAMYAEDHPMLLNRSFAWPAGVDVDYWQPNASIGKNKILIYAKNGPGVIPNIEPYIHYLKNAGWDVDTLEYGCFTHDQYREKLHHSSLLLGFVASESQGLAWAEAWSMNVPTLIWKRTQNTYQGRQYRNSSAPYLCKENGLFFNDFEDFKLQFDYWGAHRERFQPRTWVLAHMSDYVSASLLYQKALSGKEGILC